MTNPDPATKNKVSADVLFAAVSNPALFDLLTKARNEGRQVNREEFDELVANSDVLRENTTSDPEKGHRKR